MLYIVNGNVEDTEIDKNDLKGGQFLKINFIFLIWQRSERIMNVFIVYWLRAQMKYKHISRILYLWALLHLKKYKKWNFDLHFNLIYFNLSYEVDFFCIIVSCFRSKLTKHTLHQIWFLFWTNLFSCSPRTIEISITFLFGLLH